MLIYHLLYRTFYTALYRIVYLPNVKLIHVHLDLLKIYILTRILSTK